MHEGYFEAIIQLRNTYKEAEDYLAKALRPILTKIKKVRNGFDFYVRDQKKSQDIARKFRGKFGGEFKISRKLFSKDRETSKNIYRVNILVRLPNFKISDVIKVEKGLMKVDALDKKVTGFLLKTWKKQTVNYPDNAEPLKKYETQVVKVSPIIEVLHPETYQPTPLQNKPRKEVKNGHRVKVIIQKGLWVV